MNRILDFFSSPIGGKIIMALSGALIIIFLITHALGNLLIFSSQTTLNTYAHWLQHSPFLWGFRLTMLGLFFLHIALAIRLYWQNRTARPISYEVEQDIQLGFTAKTMFYSGMVTFFFILFHLAHLTLGWVSTTTLTSLDNNQMVDVYNNLVRGFSQPLMSLFYLFSMFLIGLHLHHGLKSLFQTLGFHNEGFHQLLYYLSPALIIALITAFISVPVAIMLGVIQ